MDQVAHTLISCFYSFQDDVLFLSCFQGSENYFLYSVLFELPIPPALTTEKLMNPQREDDFTYISWVRFAFFLFCFLGRVLFMDFECSIVILVVFGVFCNHASNNNMDYMYSLLVTLLICSHMARL